MKYSRQRELVREAVGQLRNHPTADAVYREARRREPTISLATVYRNLNQLAEHGMIRRVAVPGGSEHFDHNLEYHEHMLCTRCGSVSDIWLERPLPELFAALPKAKLSGYDLLLYGVCPDCVQEEE